MNTKSQIKQLVADLLIGQINSIRSHAKHIEFIGEGWIKAVRSSLGMSATQLAERNKVSKAAISKLEKAEMSGSVTIKQMEKIANSMGCRFVYAIVPEKPIEQMVREQAKKQAKKHVDRVATHMAFEDQLTSESARQKQLNDLIAEISKNKKWELWRE